MTRRRLVQRVCLIVAGLGAAGALLYVVTGGFDLTVMGLTITAHEPRRPLYLAAAALSVYFLTGGTVWTPDRARVTRLRALLVPTPGKAAGVLALAVFGAAVVFGARGIGGADSYGYLSQAHLWLEGSLRQQQAWSSLPPWPVANETFIPLGYTLGADRTSMVPVYSPGLPLLMALAMLVGGACAALLVVPLSGAVIVLATYRLGRELVSDWTAVAAAVLVASSPTFLYMVMQPMSDVPVTAAWMVALLLAVPGTRWPAAAAGLAGSVAVLIRLNLAPLGIAPLAWIAWRGWDIWKAERRVHWQPAAAFVAGFLPGIVGAAAFNWTFHGSPLRSGYGSNSYLFRWEHVAPNLSLYSEWLTDTQTPIVWLGVIALLLPLKAIWPRGEAARLVGVCLAPFAVMLWVQYCFYAPFDAWWYLRFLLPAFPLVFISLAQAGSIVTGRGGRAVRAIVVIALLTLSARGVLLARDRWAFDVRHGASQFVLAGRVVGAVTEPTSVIFSMQHSGSLRHYAGRMTFRYDYLDQAWLDRAVAWFADRGVHPYALLDAWEVDAWRRRFAATSELGQLRLQPIRVFEGSSGMVLYDLLASGPETPRRVPTTPRDLDCQPPAPPPPFSLRP